MDDYEPSSDFLRAVAADVAPLSGSIFGDANLRLLIAMTGHEDTANRDWATFLLAQCELDGEEIRQALLRAASDDKGAVGAEALVGLARRDRALALPLVRQALARDSVHVPLFEAAAIIADPVLIGALQRFAGPPGASVDPEIAYAIKACQAGRQREQSKQAG